MWYTQVLSLQGSVFCDFRVLEGQRVYIVSDQTCRKCRGLSCESRVHDIFEGANDEMMMMIPKFITSAGILQREEK